MKKYLYGFKLYFLNSFHYRFNTVVELVFENLSLLIVFFFWNLIYGGDMQKVINGFTLSGIITYFIFRHATYSFTLLSGFSFSDMIIEGSLGKELLKPYNLWEAVYFRNLASGITRFIPKLLFVLVILPFIGRFLTWNLTVINAMFVLAFLLVGSISSHLLWSLFGYMAFWLEEANAVMWSFNVLLNMATGLFIPLDFFPKWSIGILEILPFSSWGYIPTKAYLGMLPFERMLYLLAIHVMWIAALLLLNAIVWKAGVKEYSSVGG